MSDFHEILGARAWADVHPWLFGLFKASWQAGLLVLVVLAAQALLGARLSPRWRAGLWLLVVGRLLLPISVPSTASVFNVVPSWPAAGSPAPGQASENQIRAQDRFARAPGLESMALPAAGDSGLLAPRALEESHAESAPGLPPALENRAAAPDVWRRMTRQLREMTLGQVAFGVWVSGALALMAYLLALSIFLSRKFAGARPLTDPGLLALVEECRQSIRARQRLALVESSSVSAPALHGLLRPKLLLPPGFATAFSGGDLRFVILHELAHVKRRDLWLNWIAAILQAAHWFNPLVWLAFYRWRADRELACDALALEAAGTGATEAYGKTILRLLRDFTYRSAAPGMVGILEDHRQLTRRIQMIARFKPARRLGLLSALAAAALSVICLTDAQVTNSPKTGGASKSPPNAAAGSDAADAGAKAGDRELAITVLEADSGQPLAGAEIVAPYIRNRAATPEKRLTDSQGRYLLRIPAAPGEFASRLTHFSVTAQHPQFAPRTVAWTSSSGNVHGSLPAEATIKLQKGVPIGGAVMDARGAPIPGVAVLLRGSGYRGFTMGGDVQKAHEYPELFSGVRTNPAAITDSGGRWSFSQYPADLQSLDVELIRPDESRYTFTTASGVNNVNRHTPIELSDLLAEKAVFTLPDGITVRGVVVDETGAPIAGALVKEGYGHGNVVVTGEFKTGEDGRFERLNRAPRQWIYTASAPGRATVSLVAQVEPGMPEARLTLPPAQPLRLVFVDETGKPLEGVSLRPVFHKNEGQLLDWEAKSDESGRVVWTNAPLESLYLYAGLANGAYKTFKVRADGAEQRLTLGKPPTNAVVTVSAVDAQTRSPIKISTVYKQLNGAVSMVKAAEPNAFKAQVAFKLADWQPGMGTGYRLKVEADGYEPALSEYVDLERGDHEMSFALRKSAPLAGVARLSDGRPASAAIFWVASQEVRSSVFCNAPGRYYGDQFRKIKSDSTGRFELPPIPPDTTIVITHDDGVLVLKAAELANKAEIRLSAWARIEGRMLVAGQPAKGKTVMLSPLMWAPDIGLHVLYSAKSGENGKFTFTNVPPGEFIVSAQKNIRMGRATQFDHPMPIAVKPGQTLDIAYATAGRPVAGQAQAEPPEAAVDWLNDDHLLVLKQAPLPPVNREDFATFQAFSDANQNSYSSPARLRQAREARAYVLDFDRDGAFRADDIPPGEYELRIQATKPRDARAAMMAMPEDVVASLTADVTIPPGQGEVDLGVFRVVAKGAPAAPRAALDAPLQTPDGRPLSLEKFRGKPTLVVLWAAWSERSKELFPELAGMRARLGGGTRFHLLDVRMDDGAEAAPGMTGSQAPWQHAIAKGQARVKLIAALDAQTLPAIVLLDADGKILARDLSVDRLETVLQRALKGN